jgi:hypothetical protein
MKILMFTVFFASSVSIATAGPGSSRFGIHDIDCFFRTISMQKRFIHSPQKTKGFKPEKPIESSEWHTLKLPKKVEYVDETHETFKTPPGFIENIEKSLRRKTKEQSATDETFKKKVSFDKDTSSHSIVSSPVTAEGSSRWSQRLFGSIDSLFDKRKTVNQLIYPWSVHGYIFSSFPSKNLTMRGTGTLIGNRSVLTAAHCLYHKELTKNGYQYTPAEDVYFFSGLNEGKYLYGARATVKKDDIPIHPKYLQNHRNYDFGVISIDQDIGTKMGFSALSVITDLALKDRTVNVTGYPASVSFLEHLLERESSKMYSASGKIVDLDEDMFWYRIDTSSGQSGAGVWGLDSENIMECYGIHVLGSKVQGNGAVRINSDNFDVIKNWLKDFKEI